MDTPDAPEYSEYIERPHPGDPNPAADARTRKRIIFGLLVAVGVNVVFLTLSTVTANFLSKLLHPYFFRTRTVYIETVAPPSPTPAPSGSARIHTP